MNYMIYPYYINKARILDIMASLKDGYSEKIAYTETTEDATTIRNLLNAAAEVEANAPLVAKAKVAAALEAEISKNEVLKRNKSGDKIHTVASMLFKAYEELDKMGYIKLLPLEALNEHKINGYIDLSTGELISFDGIVHLKNNRNKVSASISSKPYDENSLARPQEDLFSCIIHEKLLYECSMKYLNDRKFTCLAVVIGKEDRYDKTTYEIELLALYYLSLNKKKTKQYTVIKRKTLNNIRNKEKKEQKQAQGPKRVKLFSWKSS